MLPLAVLRLRGLGPTSFNGFKPDLVRLINSRSFTSVVDDDTRRSILTLIARGSTKASEIASKLHLTRTSIYRYLKSLYRAGFICKRRGHFFIASRLFLVYDVVVDDQGSLLIKINQSVGGIVDEDAGFIVIREHSCHCGICAIREECLSSLKRLAKKLDVKIRSESPLEAFKEIVKTVVTRDIVELAKRGYLVLKIPELDEERE